MTPESTPLPATPMDCFVALVLVPLLLGALVWSVESRTWLVVRNDGVNRLPALRVSGAAWAFLLAALTLLLCTLLIDGPDQQSAMYARVASRRRRRIMFEGKEAARVLTRFNTPLVFFFVLPYQSNLDRQIRQG